MKQLDDGSFYDDSIIPAKAPGERLEPGYRSHDFIVNTVTGSSLRLGDFANKRLWMAFYRYSGCPVCASHFDEVIAYQKELKKYKIDFVAIFDSNSANIPDRVRDAQQPGFYVVGNESKGLYEIFGVEKSLFGLVNLKSAMAVKDALGKGYKQGSIDGSLLRMPAHFLIEAGGEVIQAHYAKDIGDHISWDKVGDFALLPPKESEFKLAID